MDKNQHSSNYEYAKAEADKADQQIIEALQEGKSFRVEAGAGSGKTYSLNKAIEWLQSNKWAEYNKRKQNIVCITYTNAAVDVITERLPKDSFIIPSTIHSFAWNAIKQYQSFLINAVKTDSNFIIDHQDESDEISEVTYTLGHRYIENGVRFLYHNEVLDLFCKLLDNAKFRHIFSSKYPLILIDEYQDTYNPIIERFIKYFISENKVPQFGFFGDAWQTIYQSNKACGIIEHGNLKVIKKKSNFRSAPKIVELLSVLRPSLPQISAIDDFQGEVTVITCEDYTGVRRTDRGFKDDLPSEELKIRLTKITEKIAQDIASDEKMKVLMITHNVLAMQQGYEKLLYILKDSLKNKEDPFLLFFMNIVEPIYNALKTSNMQLLFDTLKIKRYPITKKSEKSKWQIFQKKLEEARSKKAIDIIEIIYQTKLIPTSPELDKWYGIYHNAPETIYFSDTSVQSFLDLGYSQFLAAIDFLYPEALFSTEHGVKGEEYENVVFVISKGWNLYQFEKYAPLLTKDSDVPEKDKPSFERNSNLFYVCCSRPKKRLFLFVSIPIDSNFESFLIKLVGKENYFTYSEYIEHRTTK